MHAFVVMDPCNLCLIRDEQGESKVMIHNLALSSPSETNNKVNIRQQNMIYLNERV